VENLYLYFDKMLPDKRKFLKIPRHTPNRYISLKTKFSFKLEALLKI